MFFVERWPGWFILRTSWPGTEQAARDAGFSIIELGSTLSGEALYLKCGYREVSRETLIAENGSDNLVITMAKQL